MKQNHLDTKTPMLAEYTSIGDYMPEYGDMVIWAGWISQWNGFVVGYDPVSTKVEIIFSSLMLTLLTMSDVEQKRETKHIELHKIKNSTGGEWSVMRSTKGVVWYV